MVHRIRHSSFFPATLQLLLPALRLLSTKAASSSVVSIVSKTPPGRIVHDSVLSTIGNTPIVRLSSRLKDEYGVPDDVNLFAKVEALNPGGSVKDRLALGVLEWAEEYGRLKPGQTVVEASSGNTGIGLAVACAAKGHPFVCVMAESFSIERRKLMRFLGAKVVLTNPAHKGSGMVNKAKELAAKHGWFLPRQFESEANAWVHAATTGPEIVEAFDKMGEKLDYLVCAYGTGGTLKGVGGLAGGVVGGTGIALFSFASAMGKHAGTLANAISMDSEWKHHRRAQQQRHAQSTRGGLLMGAQSLGQGLLEGGKGVFVKPVAGAMDDGARGFVKGLGTGLTLTPTRIVTLPLTLT